MSDELQAFAALNTATPWPITLTAQPTEETAVIRSTYVRWCERGKPRGIPLLDSLMPLVNRFLIKIPICFLKVHFFQFPRLKYYLKFSPLKFISNIKFRKDSTN